MPVKKLRAFLDDNGVKYLSIRHSPAFTAQEIAAAAHVPGKELAKTVVVKLGDDLGLAVLPASYRVDFDLLRSVSGVERVELASEEEFRDRFPGCELGAMPPFGNLYGMETFVAKPLAEDDEIAFNAGSHTELIRMGYADFERLVRPQVLEFAARTP
jgi:Ala-tRNA(Pro) deacylase